MNNACREREISKREMSKTAHNNRQQQQEQQDIIQMLYDLLYQLIRFNYHGYPRMGPTGLNCIPTAHWVACRLSLYLYLYININICTHKYEWCIPLRICRNYIHISFLYSNMFISIITTYSHIILYVVYIYIIGIHKSITIMCVASTKLICLLFSEL